MLTAPQVQVPDMQPLTDSTELLNQPEALRQRAAEDGYILIRGLLPSEDVEATGREMAAVMAEAGWIERYMPLAEARANL